MRLTSGRSHRDTGFTLVEMLVSLAILGLAASMLLTGIGTSGRALERLGGGPSAIDEVAHVQLLLRTRIERLRVAAPTDASLPPDDVRGTADEIMFAAPAPDRQQPVGLRRYWLRLSARGELMLYSAHPLDDRAVGDSIGGWLPTRLLTGVTALSIAYYDDKTGSRTRWRTNWVSPRVPGLVRISVGFHPDDRRRWPDLVVRPGTVGSLACATDDSGTRCEPAG